MLNAIAKELAIDVSIFLILYLRYSNKIPNNIIVVMDNIAENVDDICLNVY